MSAQGNDDQQARVEELIYEKYPHVQDLLVDDILRKRLRVIFRCPNGHRIEEVVLDADHNGHLFLRARAEYEGSAGGVEGIGSDYAENAVAATKWQSPDTMRMARLKLPCPRAKCRYDGTKTQAELLKLFVMARFVLDTPDIRLPD
jgi:hypothetical protein